MQESKLRNLALEIHRQKTEKQTIELKSAAKGFPKIFGTLSSFANQDADIPMTPFEVYSYEAFRKRTREDLRTVDNAKVSLFNQESLKKYLTAVKTEKKYVIFTVSTELFSATVYYGCSCSGYRNW